MKKFLAVAVLMTAFGYSICGAEDYPFQKSKYEYTNTTLSITSHTITSIAAVTGWAGFREIKIPNTLTGATTFYYRLDGSSTTIAAVGIPVKPGEIVTIETNQIIYLLRETAKAAATIRYQSKRK